MRAESRNHLWSQAAFRITNGMSQSCSSNAWSSICHCSTTNCFIFPFTSLHLVYYQSNCGDSLFVITFHIFRLFPRFHLRQPPLNWLTMFLPPPWHVENIQTTSNKQLIINSRIIQKQINIVRSVTVQIMCLCVLSRIITHNEKRYTHHWRNSNTWGQIFLRWAIA